MRNEKTEILGVQIRDLIVESMEQGIAFSVLVKMMKEEKQKIKKEQLEQRAERVDEEVIFRKKAENFFTALKDSYSRVNRPIMFRNKKQEEKCLEILCVFYTKGTENIQDIYSELKKRLQLQENTIQASIYILYNFIAEYYEYERHEIRNDDVLRKEKLQDFIDEILKA